MKLMLSTTLEKLTLEKRQHHWVVAGLARRQQGSLRSVLSLGNSDCLLNFFETKLHVGSMRRDI